MLTAAPAAPTQDRVVPFTAGDGMLLNLVHVTRPGSAPTKGPVLLVHGAGVRANIFRAPVQTSIVDLLLDAGYDVWMENWRASIDFEPNRWTLDQVAVHDHPFAVRKVVEETGASEVKAVIHCQGSTSFMMSAVAGLVPQVTTIVSNAVSLHPVVPPVAGLKHKVAVPATAMLTQYLNPQWGVNPGNFLQKALTGFVKATHHECDNIVCRWASFTYGVGFPTLWRHENLNDATHNWLSAEFGAVPLTFFGQIGKCIRAGHLVSNGRTPGLPADFTAQAPKTDARFSFFAGELNRCFTAESQRRTHAWFRGHRPDGRDTLHVIPGYAHLDVFMGKDAGRDVLPLMIEELDRPA
ncbi:MAG TPA: hypothetical protein VFE05_11465 [Longimicrobiaceae bacterium]|nr:hypothetical protein [Longimicrobiaceae bacterium]